MKNAILIMSLTLVSTVSFARANLKESTMQTLEDLDRTASLRVYLNKKLTTYYSKTVADNTDVSGGNVSQVVDRNFLKSIVGKHVKGLITDVSRDFQEIKVSFDSGCKEVSCSYTFRSRRGVYDLAEVPVKAGYKTEKTRSGTILRGNPLSGFHTHLEFNKSELYTITKDTVRADGHN